MLKTIYLLIILQLSYAFAGTESGNGGDVLVCPNSIELLDFYEAQLRGDKLVEIDGEDEWSVAGKILDLLAEINPTRRRVYLEGLKNFPAEIQFVQDEELIDIPDQGDIPIPRECELKQIAIHANPLKKDDYSSWDIFQPKRYKIDRNLWDKLSIRQKAGLITHELILREAVHSLGHKDTKNVRRMNAYIWDERLPKSSRTLFTSLLKAFDFKYSDLTFGDFIIFADENSKYLNYNESGPYFKLEPYKKAYVIYQDTLLEATHIGMNFYRVVTEINLLPTSQTYKIPQVGGFIGLIKFKNGFTTATTDKVLNFIVKGKILNVTGQIIIDSKGSLLEGILARAVDLVHVNYNLMIPIGAKVKFMQNKEFSYASNASGAVRGQSNDYFIIEDAEISMDTIDNRLLSIVGEFVGNVTPFCPGLPPLHVSERFEYKYETVSVSNLIEPRSCVAPDGSEYTVKNFLNYSGCSIVSSLELPNQALPCRWLP